MELKTVSIKTTISNILAAMICQEPRRAVDRLSIVPFDMQLPWPEKVVHICPGFVHGQQEGVWALEGASLNMSFPQRKSFAAAIHFIWCWRPIDLCSKAEAAPPPAQSS